MALATNNFPLVRSKRPSEKTRLQLTFLAKTLGLENTHSHGWPHKMRKSGEEAAKKFTFSDSFWRDVQRGMVERR